MNARLESFPKEGQALLDVNHVSLACTIQGRDKALVFNVPWVVPPKLRTAHKTLRTVVEQVEALEGLVMELKVTLAED